MQSIRDQLSQILAGRVCVVGVGSADYGDDAVGLILAERLLEAAVSNTGNYYFGSPRPVAASRESAKLLAQAENAALSRDAATGVRRQTGICVLAAGTNPERHVTWISQAGFDQVLFLDALDFGAEPGTVALLDSAEMRARYPQISTHRIALGTLAELIEAGNRTRVWLLGVQPASLRRGAGLSSKASKTVELLSELLREVHRNPESGTNSRPEEVVAA